MFAGQGAACIEQMSAAKRDWPALVRCISLPVVAAGFLASVSAVAAGTGPGPLARDLDGARAAALLERWSPNFAQEISGEHAERDRPLRVDFDGDWDATNNWSDLTAAAVQAPPVVYGAAVLTRTHAYLTFTLFYPRDWLQPVCVSYLCHDNDLEVALVVVRRAPEPEREALAYVETKAHFDYVALQASEIAADATGRPWIRIESQGHGMYALRAGAAPEATAFRFVARSSPEAARRDVEPYELQPLQSTLWARRDPRASHGTLWTSGETGFLAYEGSRMGRRGALLGVSMSGKEYAGGVRPPWGLAARAGERGDWFLDPAYVAAQQHGDWLAQDSPSLDYTFNPYLDDLTHECVSTGCPPTPPRPSRAGAGMGVAGGLVLATGLVSLRARRRVLLRWRRFWQRWQQR
jgi:hypothetical protein